MLSEAGLSSGRTAAGPRLRPDFPVFVLTLAGDKVRRAPLLRQLDQLGIEYELEFGIDGRNGLDAALEPAIDRAGATLRTWRRLSDGEFACALSHQAIYRRVVQQDLPGAIVLEDDAVLQPGFARFVRQGLYRRHALTLFDHLCGSRIPGTRSVPMPGLNAHRIATPPFLTTGYAVSRAAAATILSRSQPLRGTADWPCNIARLDCVALVPRLVRPPPEPAASHLAAGRTATLVAPRLARFRNLLDADAWHDRLARRIGVPFDLP